MSRSSRGSDPTMSPQHCPTPRSSRGSDPAMSPQHSATSRSSRGSDAAMSRSSRGYHGSGLQDCHSSQSIAFLGWGETSAMRTSRGGLQASYERRHGTSGGFRQDLGSPPTPRSTKQSGLTTFTDPTNHFGRSSCKLANPLDEAKVDASRAGARTRTAKIISFEARGEQAGGLARPQAQSARGDDESMSPRRPRSAYQFGRDYTPGKMGATCPASGQRSSRGGASTGVGEALGSPTADRAGCVAAASDRHLANYLNDMKRGGRSRRSVPFTPSDHSQRTGARTMMMLPTLSDSEGVHLRGCHRSTSEEPRGSRQRSVSDQSSHEDPYRLPRRGQSSVGRASSTAPDFLHHEERPAAQPPSTPRSQSQRQLQAGKRFEEVVGHMKVTLTHTTEVRRDNKAKVHRVDDSLVFCESAVKYPI